MASDLSNLKTYTLAVCLFPDVTTLDYQGPVELLCGFTRSIREKLGPILPEVFQDAPAYSFEPTFLSHTLDVVAPLVGPKVQPDKTYESAKEQFDIILVPGGGSRDGQF